jgi:transcriptional regulator with XRE-family HTH domain
MGTDGQGESPDEVFGANVRALRERLGLSQSEVARQMTERGHPWHQSTVYRVEVGEQPVSYWASRDLAAVLRTSAERFSWTGPEANETEFVNMAGVRLRQCYEVVAAAVERLLGESAAARRVVAAHEASKYERVQEAIRDVTARIEEYDLTPAVNAGIARYNERFTEDEDDGADDAVPVTDEEDH